MGLFDRFNKTKKNDNGFLAIEVKKLIDWNEPNGEGCIVSDTITKEGWKVGYMFRDEPVETQPDSGWRFLKGDENDEYTNKNENHHVFALNTICNYDPDIIPYLKSPIGTHLIRTNDNKFVIDDGSQSIFFGKQ